MSNRHQKVLRLPTVQDRVGLSRSAIYEMMNQGRFPKPVRLSAKAVGWREADIDRWIADLEAA